MTVFTVMAHIHHTHSTDKRLMNGVVNFASKRIFTKENHKSRRLLKSLSHRIWSTTQYIYILSLYIQLQSLPSHTENELLTIFPLLLLIIGNVMTAAVSLTSPPTPLSSSLYTQGLESLSYSGPEHTWLGPKSTHYPGECLLLEVNHLQLLGLLPCLSDYVVRQASKAGHIESI